MVEVGFKNRHLLSRELSQVIVFSAMGGGAVSAYKRGSERLSSNLYLNPLRYPHFLGFPGGSAGQESSCHVGDLGLIPGLG